MNEDREHDLNALAAHLEGRLGGEERQRTIEHLSQCLECRETAALLARSWPSVRSGEGARAVSGRLPALARSPWLGLAAVMVVATAVAIRLAPSPSPVPAPVATLASPATGAPAPASPAAEAARLPAGTDSRTPSAPARAPEAAIDESLLARRGGAKRVAGKTFRLVGGEWVDSTFDRTAGLPLVEINGPEEREQTVARVPQLASYAALGERVVVVLDGTVYRFRPAAGR